MLLRVVVSRVAVPTITKPTQVAYIARRVYSSKISEREKAQEEMYICEKGKEKATKLNEKIPITDKSKKNKK
ncbi:hypothetical protein DFQ27_004920 [Actinomortierella ambigua]|uniref:Uncharacterized protein n=1 Tax=Actinomortierella ambigua TaxID=1343610 RepID=A0A9P6Q1P0_9FUNG|nr:hypothetical protein DFQ27_004920 [Actinomortierella ambigua]